MMLRMHRGLSSNALSGTIPSTWGTGGGLQSLITLYLMYNKLSGFVPGSLTLLPRLNQLCGPSVIEFHILVGAGCLSQDVHQHRHKIN